MPDPAGAMRELVAAYKCLVKISQERLSAEQVGQLKQLEQSIARALSYLPRNRMERNATREFIERMWERREQV